MNAVSKELELPGAFILGAAAAPFRVLGMNAEVNGPIEQKLQCVDLQISSRCELYMLQNSVCTLQVR